MKTIETVFIDEFEIYDDFYISIEANIVVEILENNFTVYTDDVITPAIVATTILNDDGTDIKTLPVEYRSLPDKLKQLIERIATDQAHEKLSNGDLIIHA